MNDERSDLDRLLPDPARHELPEQRLLMLRELFMQEIDETHDVAAEAAPLRSRRRRRILVPLTAGVMAIVIALGAVSTLGFGVGKFWAGQTEAGDLLERIALVAANSTDIPPPDQVRDDQHEYIETYGGFGGLSVSQDVVKAVPLETHRRQIWKSVNGAQPGLLRDLPVSADEIGRASCRERVCNDV